MGRHHDRIDAQKCCNDECIVGAPSSAAAGRKERRSDKRSSLPSNHTHKSDTVNHNNGIETGKPHHHSHHSNRRKGSSSRQRRRRAKDNRSYIMLGYIVVAAYILVASFDYYISQLPSINVEQHRNNLSRRKMEFQTKTAVVPIDMKADHFIRTGKLPGSKRRGSVDNRKERYVDGGTSQEIHNQLQQAKPNLLQQLPPISSLIDADGNVVEGAQTSRLLDFSIVGFPKTGTTSLLRHLSDLTISLPKEHCDLATNNTAKLVKDIYDDHAQRLHQQQISKKDNTIFDGNQLLRGIKCPQDISSDWSIHNYAKHFPETKLIVGIRHPIFWFQSLYNFRISNVPWKKILPTSKLTKGCMPGSQGVCAWRANFHDFLARLGKTPLSTDELKLLSLDLKPVTSKVGKVFIYELTQLSDNKFRKDLKDFLGLAKDIPPIPQIDTSGRYDHLPSVKQQTTDKKIDICDSEHDAIRLVLMEKAKRISSWMREYFLKSEDVFVSNRPYFESMLKSWMRDPCG